MEYYEKYYGIFTNRNEWGESNKGKQLKKI